VQNDLSLPIENESGVVVCRLWFIVRLLLSQTGRDCEFFIRSGTENREGREGWNWGGWRAVCD
jgi:hypothetical protein